MSNFQNLSKEELLKLVEKQEKDLASKKYGLVWDNEREPEQVVLDCANNLPVLKRVKRKEIKTDDSEDNILIEGDNYHALTVLNYTHKEKIDLIYIDPPYNTGNKDFIYNDRYVDKEDGYRHSKWLNFMEKRLNLAKDLLKKTGVIFISIDDNEQANLKLLCDKIFEEGKFYALLTWIKRTKPTNMGEARFNIQQNTEYILVYGRTPMAKHPRFNLLEGEKKDYSFKDKLGKYRMEEVVQRRNLGILKRDTMLYPLLGINPKKGYRWQLSQKKYKELLENKRIKLIKTKPYIIIYDFEEDAFAYQPFWSHLQNVGTAESGKASLNDILGIGHEFETIKPLELLKKILFHSTKKDSIVLDFFAGSGSIGHATLELNKEDNSNRKFILCTNNENNNGNGYKIAEDICYPRIEKAIKGYNKNGKGEKVEELRGNLQYFKTSLIKKTKNQDQVKINLTQKCTEMLCVKENIFNFGKEGQDYKIFFSNKKNKFLCVYYNFLDDSFNEFLKEIKKIKDKKIIYMFSVDNKADKSLFIGVDNFTIEAIPQKILDVYKQLAKMNIPIKTNIIFLELNKAKVEIFNEKEKDAGARRLRIVLEKLTQKVAQNNGINILNSKGKEEKISTLNDKLKHNKIFTHIEWEESRTYLAIGNHASHGNHDEYNMEQVENFYKHIQTLLNNFNI